MATGDLHPTRPGTLVSHPEFELFTRWLQGVPSNTSSGTGIGGLSAFDDLV
jgi:hypothetical protein